MTSPLPLAGRIALVTGAAGGIGRVTAGVLAEAGADVAVADARPEVEAVAAELRARGRRAAAAVFDVADPAAVNEAVGRLREALGAPGIVVNNAGIVANVAPVGRMTAGAWQREIEVNLSGAFHLIQATLAAMVAARWGRIVNVSSIGGTGGLHHQAAYAASKAGLLGLTKTVALEHGRHGITCNAVLPGLIATENVRALPAEIRAAAESVTPARRLGEPLEVAHLIAFLVSDRAGYINGAEIAIDGGLGLNTLSLASRREARETGPAR